jgi:4-hydroxy-2-oxoheptanedioate aldolase
MLGRNYIKEKLMSKKPILGTWCIIPSPITADIISSCGLDFLIIDAEHGPISFETAQMMAIAAESRGVSPVMRVGGIIESDILKAADIGVHCIQIPNVETKSDVEQIVKFAKYPPIGHRGFSPFTRAGGYSIENSKTLTTHSNENMLIAINIEGKKSVEQIDEILTVDSLDILFIGIYDLSKSLGIPGDVDNPIVLKHLDTLTQKINRAGKIAGTLATSLEKLKLFLDMGIRYIVYLVDCDMLRQSYTNVKEKFDKLCVNA